MTRGTNTSSAPSMQLQAQRKRELGYIHQGKVALGWSDEDYRFHLAHQTGQHSAADLDGAGRATVLAHMAKLGFVPKARSFKPFGQPEKIMWLWQQIDKEGGLRDPSPAALLALVARVAGTSVSDIRFIPNLEASKVIEALKSMLDRAKNARK